MRQVLSIAEDLAGGNWGLARVIRRDAPWPTSQLQFPQTTFFESNRDGQGVDLYILDVGYVIEHEEFGDRLTILSNSAGDNTHAVAITSLAAGNTVGVARGADIFYSSNTSGTQAQLQNILSHYRNRAVLNRPAVINMSFSGTTYYPEVDEMLDEGLVVVASAGNTGIDVMSGVRYPSNLDDVIVVGAVGPGDHAAYFTRVDGSLSLSNHGVRVDVSAPGQYLYCAGAASTSQYVVFSGSSSGAAALTTGAVACILEGRDRLTTRAQVQAIRNHVRNTATTGRLISSEGADPTYLGTLPDRILYLDPYATAPETLI